MLRLEIILDRLCSCQSANRYVVLKMNYTTLAYHLQMDRFWVVIHFSLPLQSHTSKIRKRYCIQVRGQSNPTWLSYSIFRGGASCVLNQFFWRSWTAERS